jgi:hypothetical protein
VEKIRKPVVVHSYDLPALLTGGAALPRPRSRSRSTTRARLEELRKTLAASTSRRCWRTAAGPSILETAESEGRSDRDGTRGRTGLAHVVMGSVAERVVRRAHQPVVTLKLPAKSA